MDYKMVPLLELVINITDQNMNILVYNLYNYNI